MNRIGFSVVALAGLLGELPAIAASAPLVVDATGCLQVIKGAPAENCAAKQGLSVELVNTCSYAVRAQLCLGGPDHKWIACEARASMSPMEHVSRATCDTDGNYIFWGCSAASAATGRCGGDKLVGKSTKDTK